MRELLPVLPRPSHYLGTEVNAVVKDPEDIVARAALAFPDLYEIGMSYVGQRILYHHINSLPHFWAERVFAPAAEAAQIMRERGVPLCTLESDTPVKSLDALAFSLTHELCYTNVLYMLDLAGLPFRAEHRPDYPLVMAGGAAVFNAEPVAPFMDACIVGDGEVVIVEIMDALARARAAGTPKSELLRELSRMPGVYVPGFFQPDRNGALKPLYPDYTGVEKRLVPDLDQASYPTAQIVPFGKVVHDRFAVEIARGCTRGCRFCHAGMVYRPVRERSLPFLSGLIDEGLDKTGYEELSFLSLSTGDFSALEDLFTDSLGRCAAEQVSISLPSLRVGSVGPGLLSAMSGIRRTGITLAPEAGSQRLRDVINKNVTEQELIEHTTRLFDLGWNHVKLYFMIGLPTETDDDLRAILDLCLKVRDSAKGRVRRLQVAAAVSTFVPKPFTPFQWERQVSLEETRRKIGFLKDLFAGHKAIRLKWHMPEMTWLEGLFARGGRDLADLVETAFGKGALFDSWKDHLDLHPWREAVSELGIDADALLAERDPDRALPWDHINCGVSRQFLLRERQKALEAKLTEDCRYGACQGCGVCNFKEHKSHLARQAEEMDIQPRVNRPGPDREPSAPPKHPEEKPDISARRMRIRLWYEKTGTARYLSQLELGMIMERAMRRADLPVSFSQGFHRMPRISFGRALPVGAQSRAEWVNITLREEIDEDRVLTGLSEHMPPGLTPVRVKKLPLFGKVPQGVMEEYLVEFHGPRQVAESRRRELLSVMDRREVDVMKITKKGPRTVNVRPVFESMSAEGESGVRFRVTWEHLYFSPLKLVTALVEGLGPMDFSLVKLRQFMPETD